MTLRQAGLACGVLAALASSALALGRKESQVTPTYIDEGNVGIVFNVACTSYTWTAVPSSSDTIRRALLVQSSNNALAEVCLSTLTLSGDSCADATAGVHLSTGAALVDYSGLQFYCRGNSTGNVNVHGYWTRDVGDYGATNVRR